MSSKEVKFRNAFALHSTRRAAGPMKDRRAPRGGNRNDQRDLMDQYDKERIQELQDHICDDNCFGPIVDYLECFNDG